MANFFAVFAIAMTVTSCANQATVIPPERQYRQPPPSAENAKVIGSRDARQWARFEFVRLVEGKRVMDADKTPDSPVWIESGERFITVEHHDGNFKCTANFTFAASAGASYRIMVETDRKGALSGTYCDFWLVDVATDAKVTEVVRQPASRLSDRQYIPIFVPVR